MKSVQKKHVRRGVSHRTEHRQAKATSWPPRRRRRPRPAPQPTSPPSPGARHSRVRRPVCPTAQRAYEADLFADLE